MRGWVIDSPVGFGGGGMMEEMQAFCPGRE